MSGQRKKIVPYQYQPMSAYGRWAGDEAGTPLNTARCVVSVSPQGRSMIPHQCARKRGHGPLNNYCKQHANQLEKLNGPS